MTLTCSGDKSSILATGDVEPQAPTSAERTSVMRWFFRGIHGCIKVKFHMTIIDTIQPRAFDVGVVWYLNGMGWIGSPILR